MSYTIEFYIPIERLTAFLEGNVVLYSSFPAEGFIKVSCKPSKILYVRKDQSFYYIRRSTRKERKALKKRGHL